MKWMERLLINISKRVHGRARIAVLILVDFAIFALIDSIYYLASQHLYSDPMHSSFELYLNGSVILLLCTFATRIIARIYRNIWRFPNTGAYLKLILSDAVATLIAIIISEVIGKYAGIWHFVTVISLTLLLTLISRFIYRILYKKLYKTENMGEETDRKLTNVAIVGAGQLGVYLAKEISNDYTLGFKVCCFIDIDNEKTGGYISGIKIENSGEMQKTVSRYSIEKFIIAIDKISNQALTNLYNRCNSFGCDVKIFDAPFRKENEYEKTNTKKVIRDFTIEDLLFRDQVKLLEKDVIDYYSGKTVMITGGGGSIGSEICRQIAKCNPKRIIIFDIYENNAYDIQQELTLKYNDKLDLRVEIGSVRDYDRLSAVFDYYRPEIVFHAAAHKHVPLMEHCVCEAIKNNVLGTYNTVNVAEKYEVEKFIMISTDKAVNPTNVMGASKRICEMIVRSHSNSRTCFSAVRFGNVLGSNGSVIPLFRRQIEAGGPVTITDKRIIRYFMTIPEASQLVLTAGSMAKSDELFVLDMGNPVKIYDLCVNMIRLMGYEPDKDIEIREIGLRPGEKLYEELLVQSKNLSKTDNDRIFIEHEAPVDTVAMAENLNKLFLAVENNKNTLDMSEIYDTIRSVVPTFRSPDYVNKNAQDSMEMKLVNSGI